VDAGADTAKGVQRAIVALYELRDFLHEIGLNEQIVSLLRFADFKIF